jgi:hypothetical protein
MTTSAREPGGPPARFVLRAALLALVALLSIYPGAYVHARLTHRLVNYGSFIGRPSALSGIGYSRDELVFFPCVWFEETVRGI